jgi:hypothetical protein
MLRLMAGKEVALGIVSGPVPGHPFDPARIR